MAQSPCSDSELSKLAAEIYSDLNDTHETAICEDEAECSSQFEKCIKNAGHSKFIPVDLFTPGDLPEPYCSNPALYQCIKCLADLTVRIKCNLVSKDRPKMYKSHPYLFGNTTNRKIVRNGTGRIDSINWHKGKDGTYCTCPDCVKSGKPSKQWMEVCVMTAKHVVFDNTEAKYTSCMLFYNNEDNAEVTLSGAEVIYEDMEKDRCQFQCATCDVELMKKLDQTMKQFADLWKKVYRKYKEFDVNRRLICIVSHPHGHYKRITIGRSELKKAGKLWCRFYYSTPTCSGSSGAATFVVGHTEKFFYQHIHTGYDYKNNLNYSGLAW